MKLRSDRNLISTIKEKCRICYTCVRECPAKAIKIYDGQAEIIRARCIDCGNCVSVCAQKAKLVHKSVDHVVNLLNSDCKTVAMMAPSFPAAFSEIDYRKLISGIKKLGFDHVNEVSFGADLVAKKYKEILEQNLDKSYISTSCPAIVTYVEKYYPKLIENLIPVVSPMVASSRVLRQIHDEHIKIVFIGPCIAKKSEYLRDDLLGDVDCVITFDELHELFQNRGIDLNQLESMEFDHPHGNLGRLFPISRGLFFAAGIEENLITSNILAADGKEHFVEAINEYDNGLIQTGLLELMCCQGCIMGPGTDQKLPLYKKRTMVSLFANNVASSFDHNQWQEDLERYSEIDLSCRFYDKTQEPVFHSEEEIHTVLEQMGKMLSSDELNCGACGYLLCRNHAKAILDGLAEKEMCLPYSIDRLKATIFELENSYDELKRVKEALSHRERLAHMGQLSAGIAHELNNPLGSILMCSHLLKEDLDDNHEVNDSINLLVEQANRCKKIVSGLLNFSRQNKVFKEPTDIEKLIYRCFEAIQIPGNINVSVHSMQKENTINVDRDQVSQVLINVINNSIDVMSSGGDISVHLLRTRNNYKITVQDSGPGISQDHISRVFDPFFTTKQLGRGTGLGLAVSYGIIKMHSGSIRIESNNDPFVAETYTKVIVNFPLENGGVNGKN